MIGAHQPKMMPFPISQSKTAEVRTNSKDNRMSEECPYQYKPYATIHLQRTHNALKKSNVEHRQSNKSRLYNLMNMPFKRISRVENMIHKQKEQIKDEQFFINNIQAPLNTNYLKPQFKVKTNLNSSHKNTNKQRSNQNSQIRLHLQNLSLQCVSRVSTSALGQQRVSASGNNYQQIFKNRRKLNHKSNQKKQQASLLQMLNRISQGAPLHRYKSKAYGSGNKVNSFFHSS